MNRLTRMIPVIAIVCVAGLAACNDEDPFDEDADRARLDKMEAEIDELIGEANCKDFQECRSIAFGDKPCGGPWKYKIFSKASVDSVRLADMVRDYNKFNVTLNRRYGWMSDCMVVVQPGTDCLDGRCVAVEPAGEQALE
ncbi:MAG: hypothetical protein ABFS42_12665 [Candidatus Krumholzibacteriota bacterium]